MPRDTNADNDYTPPAPFSPAKTRAVLEVLTDIFSRAIETSASLKKRSRSRDDARTFHSILEQLKLDPESIEVDDIPFIQAYVRDMQSADGKAVWHCLRDKNLVARARLDQIKVAEEVDPFRRMREISESNPTSGDRFFAGRGYQAGFSSVGATNPARPSKPLMSKIELRPRTKASSHPPCEWRSGGEPSFHVPQWAALACEKLSPDQMGRHTLIMGETGSGKTKSGIFPLVYAALNYGSGAGNEGLAPSMLVIDPKLEITTYARDLNERMKLGRTIRSCEFDSNDWVVDLYEGVENASVPADEYLSALLALSPAEEKENINPHGNSAFFSTQSHNTLRALLAIDLAIYHERGPDGLSKFWAAIPTIMVWPDNGCEDLSLDAGNYWQRYEVLLNRSNNPQLLQAFVVFAGEHGASSSSMLGLSGLANLPSDTYNSVIGTVNNRLNEIADDDFAKHVWTNPFQAPSAVQRLSILDALNDGDVVCYYPRDTSVAATMIGRALKSKFFELTFKRQAELRPFVYVCDEFQRFITNDPTSGEQSFLDRCRAYRGICILATQSLASLQYVLQRDGGKGDSASIDILLNNTGNKLFFRNTDQSTHERLGGILPGPSVLGRPHITAARPVSTLSVGECYFLLSDGRWGRRKIALAGQP